MPEIDFSVYCKCGRILDNDTKVESGRRGVCITIEPCIVCVETARDEGREEAATKGGA